MDRLRCKYGKLGDELVHYEKYSSMGNGFTFELESLIFWGLARAVVGNNGTVGVYGDDVVIPSKLAPEFIELCQFCGFRVNAKKTHVSGLTAKAVVRTTMMGVL
jgi:hypothetical protein